MNDKKLKNLSIEYTIKLLNLEKIKVLGVNILKPSKESICELRLIEESIKILKENPILK